MQEKLNIFEAAAYLAVFAGTVVGISGLWIRAKRFYKNRNRDTSASDAVSEAFKTPESDARLTDLNRRLGNMLQEDADTRSTNSLAEPSRTAETDNRLIARPKGKPPENDGGKAPK